MPKKNGKYSFGNECGIGTLAVWNEKLYMINYAAHEPKGSKHKKMTTSTDNLFLGYLASFVYFAFTKFLFDCQLDESIFLRCFSLPNKLCFLSAYY